MLINNHKTPTSSQRHQLVNLWLIQNNFHDIMWRDVHAPEFFTVCIACIFHFVIIIISRSLHVSSAIVIMSSLTVVHYESVL